MNIKSTIKLNFNELLYTFSFALDKVESELVGATRNHSKRIACICSTLGRSINLNNEEILDIAACAVLHDNALTEYIASEKLRGKHILRMEDLEPHCEMGESNVENFPFTGDVKGFILHHHENPDGTGPFRQKKISLGASIIRLADNVDVTFDLSKEMSPDRLEKILGYVKRNTGILFQEEASRIFIECFKDGFYEMGEEKINDLLKKELPTSESELSYEQIENIANIFAKIIDYKSEFTSKHSVGVASRAAIMADYYGFSPEEKAKYYLAASLHDTGKLAIPNKILEKPGKLTREEFDEMKKHALYTYDILKEGFGDMAGWAAFHHEKLDGSGYPFGKKADELNKNERLMACIDVYQALVEQRPYKKCMTHEQAIAILREMAQSGTIDPEIVEDVAKVLVP